ncbi:hypothetical protein CRX72_28110 [Pantoea sp. BRM17]|nr:hypothetical protein CRX72_28110 [Pantoea sp. BRM17]
MLHQDTRLRRIIQRLVPRLSTQVDNAQLRDVNEAIRQHPIETVGRKLRGYMTDMKRIAVAG